jgi:hypothetical protein
LDAELQSAGPNVGIAFGIELFKEFDEHGTESRLTRNL